MENIDRYRDRYIYRGREKVYLGEDIYIFLSYLVKILVLASQVN